MAGRTVSRWTRFGVHNSSAVAQEIPITSLSPVGLIYAEENVGAWQDKVMGFLAMNPTAAIEIGGPWGNKAVAGFAASGLVATLSGAHTVLNLISVPSFSTPLALGVHFGIQGYWTDSDPVFGIASATSIAGYCCLQYTTNGTTYTARFQPIPGAVPVWSTTIIS